MKSTARAKSFSVDGGEPIAKSLGELGACHFKTIYPNFHYQMVAGAEVVIFDAVEIRREHSELVCHLRVSMPHYAIARTVNDRGMIASGTFSLSKFSSRGTLAGQLCKKSGELLPKDLFEHLLEMLCAKVEEALSEGQPSVILGDVAEVDATRLLDIAPLPLMSHGENLLFAHPDSAKTILLDAALGNLALSGRRPGILDFEWTPYPHQKRLRALFGPNHPRIPYLQLRAPLVTVIDRARKFVRDHQIEVLGIDSLTRAVVPPIETSENAGMFFAALASLNVPMSILTAHVTKYDEDVRKPFGSMIYDALVRFSWALKATATGPNELQVTCRNDKHNDTGALAQRVLTLSFGDRLTIRPTALSDVKPEISESLSLVQRLSAELAQGPCSIDVLAGRLGAKPNTVSKSISRYTDRFKILSGKGEKAFIGLKSQRPEDADVF